MPRGPKAVKVETISAQVRLPPDLHAALKSASERDQRSLNSEIVYLLRQALREEG